MKPLRGEVSGGSAVVPPANRGLNRRRIWFLSVGSIMTLWLGAIAVCAALAGPSPVALSPGDPPAAPAAPTGPTGSPSVAAQQRSPSWDAPQTRQPVVAAPPPRSDHVASTQDRPDSDGGGAPAQQPAQPPVRPSTQPPAPPADSVAYYKNCGQARKAGVTPLHATDPGYSAKLDQDGDGLACENGKSK